ncbi:hypothetical protein SAMN05216466_103608 [Paraburkholderia phenazinium]|uniref:Uncharacterized protein n=1 Tax=Paraburkholderia phenazinium TaxID=60549 RepID=A0A1G7UUI8_9BURK|nr:hypothetical protein [Paraburkholderia phenazinium]SDG51164.1 hypothetical protein SAMN05216466_103608 [Paraburkholderia phenazinium]
MAAPFLPNQYGQCSGGDASLTSSTHRLSDPNSMKTLEEKSHAKLPVEVRSALDAIMRSVMAFDRLTLWIDHPAPDVPVARIAPHCKEIQVLTCQSLRFQPTWQTQVRLLQPGRQALIELLHALRSRHRARLSYIEPALDWPVADRPTAQMLERFLLKHLRVTYMRQAVEFEEGTAYFARRADHDGMKNARNIVLYADRKSKLWPARDSNSSCCHVEYRFQGFGTLAEQGLASLEDCINFDHYTFWVENLRLFRLPSNVELGRWLNPKNPEVTGSALGKRANLFLDNYRHGNAFVLQNCWRENAFIANAVTPLDNTLFLKHVTL